MQILAARGQPAGVLAKAVAAAAPKDAGLILVIDDYQYVAESPDADSFMSELMSLTKFRLLMTSRVRPAWLTPRMTVYGEATVLEMAELAFTDEEAQEVLGAEGGQTPEAIVSQAHGWPAVIGLAAMRRAPAGPNSKVQAEDLYDYFAEDLFRSASPELKTALFFLALGGDASVEVARELLGPEHERLVAEATERGFLGGGPRGSAAIHPLLRGFLVTKLHELAKEEMDAIAGQVVQCLASAGLWDTCLAALQAVPRTDLVASTLSDALFSASRLRASGNTQAVARALSLARPHFTDLPSRGSRSCSSRARRYACADARGAKREASRERRPCCASALDGREGRTHAPRC